MSGSDRSLSRRDLLRRGALGVAGLAAAGTVGRVAQAGLPPVDSAGQGGGMSHDPALASTQGNVTNASIEPHGFLEHFDYGTVSRTEDGRTVREYRIAAVDLDLAVDGGRVLPRVDVQRPGPRPDPARDGR